MKEGSYEEAIRRIGRKKRLKKKSIIAIVLIIFMIGVIAGISKIADSRTVGVQSIDTEKDESIIYKGETYVPKKNISTYLIAGIDSSDKIKKLKEYDGNRTMRYTCFGCIGSEYRHFDSFILYFLTHA